MSGSPLFCTESGNPFGIRSSEASSSQESVLSSIGSSLYSQPAESLTQVYYGPSQQPIMTSDHSDDFSTTQGIGSHNLLGEEHEMNVMTPNACESCDDGATTTHEPPEIENVRENLKLAFTERFLAAGKEVENDAGNDSGKKAEKKAGKEAENEGGKEGGKETGEDMILEQNDANFKLALVSAETKKQDNKESRKGGSKDKKTEYVNNDISPSMPSMLFVPAQEKTSTVETCVVENPARTTHVPETLALKVQNLEEDAVEHESPEKAEAKQSPAKVEEKVAKPTTPDEPKVEEKVAKPTTPDEPKVEEKVAKPTLKRHKSHVVVHPEGRRVVQSVLKGTEEFDANIVRKAKEFKQKNAKKESEKKQKESVLKGTEEFDANIARKAKEFKQKNAKKESEKKQKGEGAKGGKGKPNESKGTFQAKKVEKKSKKISSDKSVEVDKGKSDVEKDGEIFLADVLGDIDIQKISQEEGVLLLERLQLAQVSCEDIVRCLKKYCEDIVRCLKKQVKSLTASRPVDEDEESENKAKIEESQARIIEYTAKLAEFARVMNPLSKKLSEHSDKELERSANSVYKVGGLVTKPRDEMDCSDPLFLLDNVHDKAPEDGEGSAQGSGANALKKRKNKDTGKKTKGSRDDEGKKRKIESDETPEADNSLSVKLILYAQIRRLESDVSIYKDSSMLNLQEKERKAADNTLLKNKVRELTSKLEGVENDNSKTIAQNGKLEKEVERLKASKGRQNSSFNDKIDAQMLRESALDARIDALEEELKSKGESLKAVERALEETRAVVNAANSVVDAVKASSRAPKYTFEEKKEAAKVAEKIPANETNVAAKIPANETKAAAKNAAREEKAAAKEAKRLEQFQPSQRVINKRMLQGRKRLLRRMLQGRKRLLQRRQKGWSSLNQVTVLYAK